MTSLIKTNEKVEVANYPYGYTLKTTLFDTIEFNAKKGYRHVTQTINPKTGKLNAPKKSTYYAFTVRYTDWGFTQGGIKSTNVEFIPSAEKCTNAQFIPSAHLA